ncbi:MAG: hypothetical protein DYG89_28905 [Caldilinea sp. CFX5]|nr:hypothetical protein [Caldilinea sp. CFX5]
MSNKSGTSAQIISLPKGGGALAGIGEKFAPDLFTGTGNFTVPIALPPGRNGFQPQLNLVYSTGAGNGPFGLGWTLSIPGVSRQTTKGLPRYDDTKDIFVLSGAEDLVPIAVGATLTRYRPRTEGLFARIEHHQAAQNDYWQVWSKDGLKSYYGTPGVAGNDPAVVANPDDRSHIFAWKLARTEDAFGNRIEYLYERDTDPNDGPHHWDQLYLSEIRYVDYGEPATPQFLVKVRFHYPDRPDPFSDYRAGFEIRTSRRCTQIEIYTHADKERLVRTYDLCYLDSQNVPAEPLPRNGVSLLNKIIVVGHDGDLTEALPPLAFGYTVFDPAGRKFSALTGRDLPARSLASPDLELVDLFGNGLPDILEMNGVVRYWRNLGGGRFDLPRAMSNAPAGLRLADPGVQMIDANGDGRADLMVTTNGMAGYFPLRFGALWDRRSFQRYAVAPSFNLEDPAVRLVDLNGDGVTDAIRAGSRLECFFNDPHVGWQEVRFVERQALAHFPNVSFADPRVKWGDMSGDGLQAIVLIHEGCIEYWPNLGHGRWGRRITMHPSPRLPYDFDPKRLLLGDVDGDGLADLVYVEDTRVTLWLNRSGNGWSDPVTIHGTPPVTDMDAVRLVDLLGSGIAGVLWSRDAGPYGRGNYCFLDFTGGVKPYLLHEMDNHMGALTRVEYAPATRFYLQDEAAPGTRWQTPLPFPVQVVARVEVIDHFSQGKLTTEYSYHHGYWDGVEREFRGFGRVEQRDSETFSTYHQPGLHGPALPFAPVDEQHFSPPTLTKTWFHQGAIEDGAGGWTESDFTGEFWPGDPSALPRSPETAALLAALPPQARRDALRSLRGRMLRTELYALDETERQARPYTVTEQLAGVCAVVEEEGGARLVRDRQGLPPAWRADGATQPIFFPHTLAQRTTQWERGDEPLTQFSFSADYDAYGQPTLQINLAVPRWRGRNFDAVTAILPAQAEIDTQPRRYLATFTRTAYAQRDDPAGYMVDRVAKTTTYQLGADQDDATTPDWARRAVPAVVTAIKTGAMGSAALLIGQTLNYYDGPAFTGLPFGQLGPYGALVRSENFVLPVTDAQGQDFLAGVYGAARPPYLLPGGATTWPADYPPHFQALLAPEAGYIFYPGGDEHDAGYFVAGERRQYDFHSTAARPRGLLTAKLDPLGTTEPVTRTTRIAYDPYQLLPERVIDPAGLLTTATYDYRVLQPTKVTDPNANVTRFTFTPLGLLKESWVCGKLRGELAHEEGDRTRASVQMSYDLLAYARTHAEPAPACLPVSVRTLRFVHHDTATGLADDEREATITTVEYSDGFGRLLQTRTQAEDLLFGAARYNGEVLPVDQADREGTLAPVVGQMNSDANNPNVVVSGWQSYDNKGRVVAKFEPFFATSWAYRPQGTEQDCLGRTLQKVTMFYDPRGQVMRTLNPDGSEQRVIYGVPTDLDHPEQFTPTAWAAYTYDTDDNAGRTHGTSARSYDHCWNTPASIVIDALGRTVAATQRNRPLRQSATEPLPPVIEYHTWSTYDLRGNLLTVSDALGRLAFRYHYDLANRPLRSDSLDAGTRLMVLDAAGNEVERRDSKGALLLHTYDELNRPTNLWARDGADQPLTLRERLLYGDSAQSGLTEPTAKAANLYGKLYRHYDEAGLLTFEQYDFKGNMVEKLRQVISDAAILATFPPVNDPSADWRIQALRVDWANAAATLLDPVEYRESFAYDALNRIQQMRYPQDVEGGRKQLVPHYNRAGALERVTLDGAPYVERIAYNAKGQRVLLVYGNGVLTRYAYDSQTFRLARLRSEPCTATTSAPTYQPAATDQPLQDFAYAYDLAGNILRITDQTPGCGVRNNPEALLFPELSAAIAAGDALVRRFAYDPLYRLTAATGREALGIPSPRPPADLPREGYNWGAPGTPSPENARDRTQLYSEQYSYDPAGNMLAMHHAGNSGAWTRHFGMGGLTPQVWNAAWPTYVTGVAWLDPPSNRLTHVGNDEPGTPQTHCFDENGNLIRENTARHFEWDHSDRMKVFRTQVAEAEPSIHAHYLYDAAGQRVKKLVRKQGGGYEVTVYIDGVFEHHRLATASETAENNTLHVMDNQNRIALMRVGAAFSDDGAPETQIKYHLSDHLGSSNVVIGGQTVADGTYINHEEYFPYGETSFGSFACKRYRFTGNERDEESGLCYHAARYYAPCIVRWVSCDPLSLGSMTSAYSYANSRPMIETDKTGLNSNVDENTLEVQTQVSVGSEQSEVNLAIVQFQLGQVNTKEEAEKAAQLAKVHGGQRPHRILSYLKDFGETRLLQALFQAARQSNLDVEFVTAVAFAEGLILWMPKYYNNPSAEIDGFSYLGTDRFAKEITTMKREGFLRANYGTNDYYILGTATGETGEVHRRVIYRNVEAGIEALAAMLRYRQSLLLADFERSNIPIETLSQEQLNYWTYVYYNAGVGGTVDPMGKGRGIIADRIAVGEGLRVPREPFGAKSALANAQRVIATMKLLSWGGLRDYQHIPSPVKQF